MEADFLSRVRTLLTIALWLVLGLAVTALIASGLEHRRTANPHPAASEPMTAVSSLHLPPPRLPSQ